MLGYTHSHAYIIYIYAHYQIKLIKWTNGLFHHIVCCSCCCRTSSITMTKSYLHVCAAIIHLERCNTSLGSMKTIAIRSLKIISVLHSHAKKMVKNYIVSPLLFEESSSFSSCWQKTNRKKSHIHLTCSLFFAKWSSQLGMSWLRIRTLTVQRWCKVHN